MIEAAVIQYVIADPGASAIAGSKFYPSVIPGSVELPAARLERISSKHYSSLTGGSGLILVSFRFECFARTYKEARELAEAIRIAIEGKSGTWSGVVVTGVKITSIQDLSVLEDGVFRLSVAFDLFHN